MFALEIFKSLQVNSGRNGYSSGEDMNCIDDSIRAADALLNALEQTSPSEVGGTILDKVTA